jgi:hypothetical protein
MQDPELYVAFSSIDRNGLNFTLWMDVTWLWLSTSSLHCISKQMGSSIMSCIQSIIDKDKQGGSGGHQVHLSHVAGSCTQNEYFKKNWMLLWFFFSGFATNAYVTNAKLKLVYLKKTFIFYCSTVMFIPLLSIGALWTKGRFISIRGVCRNPAGHTDDWAHPSSSSSWSNSAIFCIKNHLWTRFIFFVYWVWLYACCPQAYITHARMNVYLYTL